MEETKLLRILVLMAMSFIVFTNNISFANDFVGFSNSGELEKDWTNDILEQGRDLSMDNIKDSMSMTGFDQDLRSEVLNPRPSLQIFVSSSMSKELLKAYGREASIYGGALVFRGLPDGSIHKLIELVTEISDEKYPVAMQIDDQSFEAYEVENVPAIVLSKEPSMFLEQLMPNVFDKVTGTITIRSALEMFSQNGDMAHEAKRLLK